MRSLVSSVLAIVVLTAVFGFGYPALMTGFASVGVPAPGRWKPRPPQREDHRLASSRRSRSPGRATSIRARRGRRLRTTRPARPSSTSGRRTRTSRTLVAQNAQAILKLERPYNPGLTIHDIPVDAVTTSGSGIDPDISPANAALQSRRVAAVRHLPLATVQKLIT